MNRLYPTLALCMPLACLSACASSPYVARSDHEPGAASGSTYPGKQIETTHTAPATSRLSIPDLPQLPPQSSTGSGPNSSSGLGLPPFNAAPEKSHAPHFGTDPRGRARAALYDLEHRANLNDAQRRKIHKARMALKAGHNQQAAQIATQLDSKLRSAIKHYKTRPGDTLNLIAEKIYGNAYLWPLIWQANRKRIANPRQLHAAITLNIHLYPTLDQAAAALAYAHRHTAQHG